MKNSSLHQTEDVSLQVKSSLVQEGLRDSAGNHQNGGKQQALSSVATEDPLMFSAATKGEDAKSWQKAIDTEVKRPLMKTRLGLWSLALKLTIY